ncbi:zonadhesin-like [Solanum tuberosum]|uniref:zonadhesin-like n=1 Tax=Solanum tuberosum TaxID=4113 RepID=UPI00073A2849|nr:PREDICTED: zonadhesin-like [Solanum tuberosum]XP_015169473.1 PREDICTED: zonadhesin-like [Solanum tuberosum]XP_015169474.1 PREDICTED: zonadhesin-like [Solanum tuberosum]XP_015169475.1 PREDICTED: zonadhesin-like [Solanum tuberosum]XP_015169476.1 PREDICTED: zonadhesin-like [Solanum tuberosum]XP_015169477.1 PREDICTED: zonadhesin-like [Solanum tuberosum]XP_015169478.1 PREDICTED: zonadhesin-like [Solanum tuberosum]XP_015169479.1 PREDICTED: zonadhesin-like [Solanum tuberosum]XP_015169480.1 PRED
MEENTNNMPTQETTSDRNLRRRTRYAQMSLEKKQFLLSQLREKRATSKRQKNLHQSNSTAALTISISSSVPEQASKNTIVPSDSPTGEHVLTCLPTSELASKNTIVPSDSPTGEHVLTCLPTSELASKYTIAPSALPTGEHIVTCLSTSELASKNTIAPSDSPTGEHIVTCLSASKLGMEENTNTVPTQETTSDTNLRRRTRYAQMSPERKQLLLSQLREKRAESKRQKTCRQSNSTAALAITNPSLSPEKASKRTNVPCSSTRGEHIVTCLSTFELGSTSTTCHVASKLNSRRAANKAKVCIRNVWRT